MKTTAVKDGNDWIINGTKSWITHGKSGDVAVVICRTGEPRTKNNATAFVVERGTKGFSAGKKENKLGMRASETAEMIFDNCRIPDANRLGEVGSMVLNKSLKVLDGGRISIASFHLVLLKVLMKQPYNIHRNVTSLISLFPVSREYHLNLLIWLQKLQAADLLTLQACDLKNRGEARDQRSGYGKILCQ